MKQKITADQYRNRPRTITRTTILILSGWCLGMSSAGLVADSRHWLVFLVGLTGLIGFVALEYAAWRRKQLSAKDAFEQTLERLDHDRLSEQRKRKARTLAESLKATTSPR